MHQYAAKNCCGGNACGLDVLAHQLADSGELRGVSVSFHEGRIDYATAGEERGEREVVGLADAVRALGGESICRWSPPDSRCGKCGRLLEGKWEEGVFMRRDGDKIILERESCPTAPKFWLWKILGGVKLEVRQLPSVVGAGKKWKVPLALAVVCGMAGLLGWWAEGWSGKLFCLVAY